MASQTQLVAEAIRAEMARKRVTQTAIAAALGTTQQSVSARVNGRVPIDVDELAVFARVLGVAPAQLLPAHAHGTEVLAAAGTAERAAS